MTRAKQSIFSRDIVFAAIGDSFLKLDPRTLFRNPVIFIVEIGSVITTAIFFRDLFASGESEPLWFTGTIAFWLWLTVLFANFAEAIAEGRGKAQANALRATRTTTIAFRRSDTGRPRGSSGARAPARRHRRRRGGPDHSRRRRDHRGRRLGRRVRHHRRVRSGHPRGRRRPLGRHRRHAAALRPARDRGHPGAGQSFLDRMIALVEGAERRKTPNEIALNILLAGLTITFLAATVTLRPFAIYAGTAALPDRPHRPPRRPHPDDHRRAALGDRHRRHGPARPAQRPRDVGPRRRGLGRRRRAAPRQDGNDHARQPPGRRVPARQRRRRARPRPGRAARIARRRDARGPLDRRSRQGAVRAPRAGARRAPVHPVLGLDAHERRRPRRPQPPQGRRRRGQALRRGERRTGAGRARHPRARRRAVGRNAPRRRPGQLGARRRAPEGHRQGRHERALRRASQHGHPHGDDHRRQPGDRRRHRRGVGRRRLPRRGDARAQARADPRGAGTRPHGRDDRRRHERRAGARTVRRRRRDEHGHDRGEGGRQHGRPRLEPDEAHRDRRGRQAAPHHARIADDLLDRERRREVLRDPPGDLRLHVRHDARRGRARSATST